MINTMRRAVLLSTVPILLLAGGAAAQAPSSFDLRSPDHRIELRIRTAQQISYDVVLNGAEVLRDCPLSLDIDHKKLGVDAQSSRRQGTQRKPGAGSRRASEVREDPRKL